MADGTHVSLAAVTVHTGWLRGCGCARAVDAVTVCAETCLIPSSCGVKNVECDFGRISFHFPCIFVTFGSRIVLATSWPTTASTSCRDLHFRAQHAAEWAPRLVLALRMIWPMGPAGMQYCIHPVLPSRTPLCSCATACPNKFASTQGQGRRGVAGQPKHLRPCPRTLAWKAPSS